MIYKFKYILFLLRECIALYCYALHDAWRYGRSSFTGASRLVLPKGRLQGRLIATTHVIEKGLAMQEMRPRFGVATIGSLRALLTDYGAFASDDNHYWSAIEALRQYVDRHAAMGIDVTDVVGELPEPNASNKATGGAFEWSAGEVFRHANSPFAAFAASRHSMRVFDTSRPLDAELVRKAVKIALTAPSACNRQPWKVYPFLAHREVAQIMKLHSGSRGFGDSLPAVIILSARMDTFAGPTERNQCFIDGGLFAMALMYALHHLKIGCVPLNWSVTPDRDRRLRKLVGLPTTERVIMLLGVGHPPSKSVVPVSQRREVDEVIGTAGASV